MVFCNGPTCDCKYVKVQTYFRLKNHQQGILPSHICNGIDKI